ncbi:hypothetical protein SERLA73DRAFT_177408 [Serpula lacrymans var. lacrymans S7.3]|uniref:Ribosomal RNA-processing protein 8 n=2 Tax=Serpula lacrymans var. lacrymans TaxID=341189 RepID=F8PNY4_SERL3|nr:uncharacterized protein SERLADRAFT_354767 [Serpula lacrymans var. lacrymans S7.9]EGO01861.1 hypothetical protein SERLA73DRAFT_177408 [Serpula lacrymans var. lacrymans S7.3]EGO27488.1 hypothetical protein SERLADRAFT_354767 [Serpula lacrymans var. lacrymans S7.9]
MALFEVPGWSLPSAPVTSSSQSTSKKRKRPADDGHKLESATVNLDKLMKTLEGKDSVSSQASKKKKKTQKANVGGKQSRPSKESNMKQSSPVAKSTARQDIPHNPDKDSRKGKKNKNKSKPDVTVPPKKPSTKIDVSLSHDDSSLTTLQKGMKGSLDGARFRWINELLYKSVSSEAVHMMKENPNVFEEYHSGFRHQVQSWPSNPVSHYISKLSTYPERTVVADLGCGDATLARALVDKSINVLSFDLVSDGAFVVEADICAKIPLPGSEPSPGKKSEGKAQVVDVVVCALSLMGTNWPQCIREAWRILKAGGELKVAEVASRFTNLNEFTSLVGSIGFKLKSKDNGNTHFTLFEFKKTARTSITDKEWSEIMSKGDVLKPCEYKRR